jgi:hypothetical protein
LRWIIFRRTTLGVSLRQRKILIPIPYSLQRVHCRCILGCSTTFSRWPHPLARCSSVYLCYPYVGFLDGGDRAATLEGQVDSAPPSSDRGAVPAFKLSSAFSDNSKTVNSLSGAHSGSTSIVVHNLPALLFAQDSDLEPLFCPFGEVKVIRKQGPSSSSQSRAGTISVLVTYLSVTGAREAKIALHGQTYGDIPLIVESILPPYNLETSLKPGRDHLSRSSLNPSASPFVIGTASAPPTCPISEDFPDYFSKPKLNWLASTSHGHRSLPASNLPSRSNSAASWSVPVARQSFYA